MARTSFLFYQFAVLRPRLIQLTAQHRPFERLPQPQENAPIEVVEIVHDKRAVLVGPMRSDRITNTSPHKDLGVVGTLRGVAQGSLGFHAGLQSAPIGARGQRVRHQVIQWRHNRNLGFKPLGRQLQRIGLRNTHLPRQGSASKIGVGSSLDGLMFELDEG